MSSDKRRNCTLIPWVPDEEWEDEEQLECNYLLMPASGEAASVTGSYTQAVPQETWERSGRMFHHRQLQKVGHTDYDDYAEVDEDEDDEEEEEGAFDDILDDPAWDLSQVQVIGRLTAETDHYQLLALGKKRIDATTKEIKSKYRRMCMIFHPDKNVTRLDFANDMIQKVNLAYDVLSDPAKRRVFDSLEDFNDEYPDEEQTKKAIAKYGSKGFFKLWGPVFTRNKRWSETKLETLGTEETLIGFVDEMYESWFDFKSWREFPQDDDKDVDKAEGRDEKRYLARQNKGAADRAKKEEKQRMNELVDLAYRYDPRIVARREAEKQAKIDAKEAKKVARVSKHVVLIQRIVRGWVIRTKYNRERNAKKKAAKEGAKKNQKANRKRVKKAAAAAGISTEYTDDLAAKLDADNALELAEKMEGCGKDATASWKHFNTMSAKVGLPEAPAPGAAADVAPAAPAAAPAAGAASSEDGWTPAEDAAFTAALATHAAVSDNAAKFDAIAKDCSRTRKECVAHYKFIREKLKAAGAGAAAAAPAPPKTPWSAAELALLSKAIIRFPAGLSERWAQITEYIVKESGVARTEKEVVNKNNDLKTATTPAGGSAASAAGAKKTGEAFNTKEPLVGKLKTKKKK